MTYKFLLDILAQVEETPENTEYMIAGYVVIFSVIALYLFSFYIRGRNLQRDLDLLESLEAEDE